MKLVLTAHAETELELIYDYLLLEAGPVIASGILNDIYQALKKLPLHPLQGAIEPHLLNLGLEHRRIIVGHYKVIYRVYEKAIYVTDIFDSRRNPGSMMP